MRGSGTGRPAGGGGRRRPVRAGPRLARRAQRPHRDRDAAARRRPSTTTPPSPPVSRRGVQAAGDRAGAGAPTPPASGCPTSWSSSSRSPSSRLGAVAAIAVRWWLVLRPGSSCPRRGPPDAGGAPAPRRAPDAVESARTRRRGGRRPAGAGGRRPGGGRGRLLGAAGAGGGRRRHPPGAAGHPVRAGRPADRPARRVVRRRCCGWPSSTGRPATRGTCCPSRPGPRRGPRWSRCAPSWRPRPAGSRARAGRGEPRRVGTAGRAEPSARGRAAAARRRGGGRRALAGLLRRGRTGPASTSASSAASRWPPAGGWSGGRLPAVAVAAGAAGPAAAGRRPDRADLAGAPAVLG